MIHQTQRITAIPLRLKAPSTAVVAQALRDALVKKRRQAIFSIKHDVIETSKDVCLMKSSVREHVFENDIFPPPERTQKLFIHTKTADSESESSARNSRRHFVFSQFSYPKSVNTLRIHCSSSLLKGDLTS